MLILISALQVRCRTQEETDEGMTLEEVSRAETSMFTTNQELQQLPRDKQGIPALIKKLATLQRHRLQEQLPKILDKVRCSYTNQFEADFISERIVRFKTSRQY